MLPHLFEKPRDFKGFRFVSLIEFRRLLTRHINDQVASAALPGSLSAGCWVSPALGGGLPQTQEPSCPDPKGKARPKFPKRKIPYESSQAKDTKLKVIKRKCPTRKIQAKVFKRSIPSEGSQAIDPKQKLSNEVIQATTPKRKI